MYPAYRWTDSYPYHTNPSAKEMDRGMNSPYYPWPYPSSHCYPTPQSCHSCCNHTYFGGPAPYSFIPPYPHYPPPPPPPFHTHGFYPPPPGAHPAYSFPPPHYSTEQPRYDYDKNTPTPTPTHHHCCGSEKKSTIQPQEPEVDKKTSESLVPFLKDCPYPIMWVPSNYTNTESNAKEKEKENHSHDPVVKPPEPSKQGENEKIPQESFPFPIFWLPSKNNEVKNDMKEDEKTRKNEVEYEKSGKHGVQKVIPVKQLETKEEKEQKTSKLPPVCLRIDPLPKKKNSSRSPSPPSGDKKRLKGSGTEDSKSCKQQTESSEGVKNDNKKVEEDSEKGVEVEGSKLEKMKTLSENEAVLMIQSVYRGFEVRKSQPLMKLREIAKVGKQVGELRKRIQDLESSCVDDKQKLVIGETIMSLLLKLDTIQGLHPVVRDVRKSVAKELVGLQEKLDSLTIVKQSTTTSADEDQTLAQPDVEATESQDADGGEVRDTGVEPEVELQNEKNTGELINNDQMEMEQPVVDREKAQSDTNSEAARLDLDDHEQVCSEELNNEEEKFDQAQPQSELQNEVNNVELNNDQMELEQPVDHEKARSDGNNDASVNLDLDDHEPSSVELNNDQEKSDQAQPAELLNEENTGGLKSDQMPTLMELEVADPTHEMKPEHLAEQSSGELNNDQVQNQMAVDTEQPVVDVVKEAQSESGIRVETMDSDEGGVEPRDINLEPEEGKQSIVDFTGDQLEEIKPPAEEERKALVFENVHSMENLTTATVEARDLGKHDLDREEAPMVDDVDGSTKELLMEDIEEVPPPTAAGNNVSIGGRKLMEENEKLRAAVEELMKAGKDQVSVIKELTGRVKDLEKKLSTKRKRKVKRSSRRPRGSLVEEELKSCV